MASKVEHQSEIGVLGLIALGVMVLAGLAIWRQEAAEASAWTAVLMAIIGAIKERWTQRSVDRMGDQLAGSAPPIQRAETIDLQAEEVNVKGPRK